MRLDQVGRKPAGAADQQRAAVAAGEEARGQRRRRRGPPGRQFTAIDNCQQLAGRARRQQIGAENGRQAAFAIVGKHRHHLDADIPAGKPGRHQQQGGRRFAGNLYGVMMARRRDSRGSKHGIQRIDQSAKRQRIARFGFVKNQHGGKLSFYRRSL
jgi:hypothetical protein